MDQLASNDITLTAVGSGRTLSLAAPGIMTVLICFAQETEAGIQPIEDAVRERWPSAADVLVAHAVDLRKVLSMFRRIAEGILAKEYQKAVEALPAGQDPHDYVVILPDWQGTVAPALGLEDPTKQLGWAALSPAGVALATGAGPDISRLIEALGKQGTILRDGSRSFGD